MNALDPIRGLDRHEAAQMLGYVLAMLYSEAPQLFEQAADYAARIKAERTNDQAGAA